ncbi:MAG TPA: hypothetical protein VN688_33890 [Gemmataceae bacterium]|nr:hypothetical protein [Gemmataceae bacterium]
MAGKDSGHPRMTANYPTGTSEGLKEKAQEMASNVGDAAGQMKDRAREFASGIADQAGERWRSASEGIQEGFSSMSHRAEDLWGDVTGMIRRYPVASLGVAFGLGCLVSCALFMTPHSDDMTRRMSRSSS